MSRDAFTIPTAAVSLAGHLAPDNWLRITGGILILAAIAGIGQFMIAAKIWPFDDGPTPRPTGAQSPDPSSSMATATPAASQTAEPSATPPATAKAKLTTTITLADSTANAGFNSSIVSDSNGFGLIAYRADGRLKVRHCEDPACAHSTVSIVDSNLDANGRIGGTSLVIGSDGLGLVAYHDVAQGDLKVAHCSDPACSQFVLTTVDTVGDVGASPSVALGGDGLPLIAYRADIGADLKVAYCQNTTCAAATFATIDAKSAVVRGPSITVQGGLGIVAYLVDLGSGALQLKVARCLDAACTGADSVVPSTAVSARGFEVSIELGSDGSPLVVYSGQEAHDLHVLHCSSVVCATGTDTPIDSDAGSRNSLVIGTDGFGLVTYYDGASRDLRVAHCENVGCTNFSTELIDGRGNVGDTNSVTIGTAGLPLISYFERQSTEDGNLKVAYCGDITCTAN
jgi:hypothetical protein